MEVVIDTHALVWYMTGDKKLGKKAKQIIDELQHGQGRLIVSVLPGIILF